MRCPLLYRLRAIDRLPEPPSIATARGTLVHAVLQELFSLDPAQRTPERAVGLIDPAYRNLQRRQTELEIIFADSSYQAADLLRDTTSLIDNYFMMEDPSRLTPEALELLVEVPLADGPLLRGYIDRLDIAPVTGWLRIVDYKTGKAPSPRFETEALFQLRFYALMLFIQRGTIPALVQLIYLANRQFLRSKPTPGDLERTQLKIQTIWLQIGRMVENREFPPVKGPLCRWCFFQPRCPLFGGVTPPWPGEDVATGQD
jgi:putative RecB family exonuclease